MQARRSISFGAPAGRSGSSIRDKRLSAGWGLVFFLACLALGAFKLWLVGQDEVIARDAPSDQVRYAESVDSLGRNGWLGDSSNAESLLRQPAYPLWIALASLGGIRLRIATEGLLIASALVFAAALRKSGIPGWLSLAAFIAIVFQQASFSWNREVLPCTLCLPLLLFGMSGLVRTSAGLVERRRLGTALATGLAFALLWYTTGGRSLVLLCLGSYVLVELLARRRGRTLRLKALLPVATALIAPTLLILAGEIAIRTISHWKLGSSRNLTSTAVNSTVPDRASCPGCLFESIGRAGLSLFLPHASPDEFPPQRDDPAASAETRRLFDRVASRNTALTSYPPIVVDGWAFVPGDRITEVQVVDGSGEVLGSTTAFHARLDVTEHFRARGIGPVPEKPAFDLEIPWSNRRLQDLHPELVFVTEEGAKASTPLVPGSKGRENLYFGIDAIIDRGVPDRPQWRFQRWILTVHPILPIILALGGSGGFLLLLGYRRLVLGEPAVRILLVLLAVAGSGIIYAAWLDACRPGALVHRGALYPIALLSGCAALILICQAGRLCMADAKARRWIPAACLLALALPLLYRNLGRISLGGSVESRQLTLAIEYLETGRLVPPLFNGEPYYDSPASFKTALIGWTARLLGRTLFAARFWDPLFAAGTILLVYAVALHWIGKWPAALASGLCLLGSRLFPFQPGAHGPFLEGPFVFLTTLSLVLCAFSSGTPGRGSRLHLVLAGAVCGLAALIEPFMGLFPLLVFDLDWALTRRSSRARLGDLAIPHLLALIPLAVWFGALIVNDPVACGAALREGALSRARAVLEMSPPGSAFLNLAALFGALHPWCWLLLLLPLFRRDLDRRRRETRFLLLWMAVVILASSFSAQEARWHLAPALPPSCILIGLVLSLAFSKLEGTVPGRMGTGRRFLPLAALTLCAVAFARDLATEWLHTNELGARGTLQDLAAWLEEHPQIRPRVVVSSWSCRDFLNSEDCAAVKLLHPTPEFIGDAETLDAAIAGRDPLILLIGNADFDRWNSQGQRKIGTYGAVLPIRSRTGRDPLGPKTLFAYRFPAEGFPWRAKDSLFPAPRQPGAPAGRS